MKKYQNFDLKFSFLGGEIFSICFRNEANNSKPLALIIDLSSVLV